MFLILGRSMNCLMLKRLPLVPRSVQVYVLATIFRIGLNCILMRVNRNCLSKSHLVTVNVDCRTARGLYRSGFTCKRWDLDQIGNNVLGSRCGCYQCPVGYASPVHGEITMARTSVLCRTSPAGESEMGHCMLLPSGVL